MKGERIEGFVMPDAGRLFLHPVDQIQIGITSDLREQIPSGIDRESRAICIKDSRESIPSRKSSDAVFVSSLLMQPFKDGDIWIGILVVAVDTGIDKTTKRFAIAGIGEVQLVGDRTFRPQFSVP